MVSAGEQADVEECRLVASLGVDMFAAGIGNIHGKYPKNWKGLNFELLEEIANVTKVFHLCYMEEQEFQKNKY